MAKRRKTTKASAPEASAPEATSRRPQAEPAFEDALKPAAPAAEQPSAPEPEPIRAAAWSLQAELEGHPQADAPLWAYAAVQLCRPHGAGEPPPSGGECIEFSHWLEGAGPIWQAEARAQIADLPPLWRGHLARGYCHHWALLRDQHPQDSSERVGTLMFGFLLATEGMDRAGVALSSIPMGKDLSWLPGPLMALAEACQIDGSTPAAASSAGAESL